MKPSIDKTSKGGGGGGVGWSMPRPWHNNTPTGPTADTHVKGKHVCQRAQEQRQTWWMAPSSHEAMHIQTCSEREEGDVWSTPPHHSNTENPIHTLQPPSMFHYHLSKQSHCNTTLVHMWMCESAYMCAATLNPCIQKAITAFVLLHAVGRLYR